MTKETLKDLGLTTEQVESVWKGISDDFITKSRFNEVNTELKQSKDTLKERDSQLETLKKSTGNVEELTKQIADLQAANKTQSDTHAAEIKQMKFDSALNSALVGAKAKNPDTVKPLLKAFLENAELDGDSIKGLDKELEKLTKDTNSSFLFDAKTESKTRFKGVTPKEGSESSANEEDPFLAGFNSED